VLPQRADDPGADTQPPTGPPGRSEFERGLYVLQFPTTLRDLLPRAVRPRWMVLLWVVITILVIGLLVVRVTYLDRTSVKW